MKMISMKEALTHQFNIDYIAYIQNEIANPSLLEHNRLNPSDFTRRRKLHFPRMIGLLMNKANHAITSRINQSYEKIDRDALDIIPTASAFVKARQKINPNVFIDLLNKSNAFFYENAGNHYEIQKWKGHTLLAVDGTKFIIPESTETEKIFTRVVYRNKREGVLHGQAVCLYDCLNKIALKTTFGAIQSEFIPTINELIPFVKNATSSGNYTDPIMIFDRLYISFELFSHLVANNIKFVIRAKTSATFKAICDFYKSERVDSILKFKCPNYKKKNIKFLGFTQELDLRAIKVPLDSGETEILITNLFDVNVYPSKCFKELYFYRWGVEVGYGIMKTLVDLEKFSSNRPIVIFQDFYMKLFLYNYCEMLKKGEDIITERMCKKRKRKHKYQVSIANLLTVIRTHLIELVLNCQDNLHKLYHRLSKYIQSELNAIRENRHIPRGKQTDSTMLVHRLTRKREHT